LRTAALLQQPQAFPHEPRLAEIVLLGDPPAQGVVPVAEDLPDRFAITACKDDRSSPDVREQSLLSRNHELKARQSKRPYSPSIMREYKLGKNCTSFYLKN
uniref:hypothetical protein n=1 Tax=Paracidovorax oryzae TaxID=862720 RepID=UPI001427C7A1